MEDLVEGYGDERVGLLAGEGVEVESVARGGVLVAIVGGC